MKLSDLQLSYLNNVLPQMRLSYVMKMSNEYNIDMGDLMSIRTAGKLKIAAYAHEKELKNHKPNQTAMDVVDTMIEKVKELAEQRQQDPIFKLKNSLDDNKDKNKIIKELLKIESIKSLPQQKKAIKEVIKKYDIDEESQKSLEPLKYFKEVIAGKIDNEIKEAFKYWSSRLIKDNLSTTIDEAYTDLGSAVILGRKWNNKKEEKINTSKSLENMVKTSDKFEMKSNGFMFLIHQAMQQFHIGQKDSADFRNKLLPSLDQELEKDKNKDSKKEFQTKNDQYNDKKSTKEIREVVNEVVDEIVDDNEELAEKIKHTIELTNYKIFNTSTPAEVYWNKSKKLKDSIREIWGVKNYKQFQTGFKLIKQIGNKVKKRLQESAEDFGITASIINNLFVDQNQLKEKNMKLSSLQLDSLINILPHMRLSHIVRMAQDCTFNVEDLMSLRTAGRMKIAAIKVTDSATETNKLLPNVSRSNSKQNQTESEDETVEAIQNKAPSVVISEITSYVKKLAKTKASQALTQLEASLPKDKKDEIIKKLNALKPKSKTSESQKSVKELMSQYDVEDKAVEFANGYTSLNDLIAGALDGAIKSLFAGSAKDLISRDLAKDASDAYSQLYSAILLGRPQSGQKGSGYNAETSLENNLNNNYKRVGGDTFLKDMKQAARQILNDPLYHKTQNNPRVETIKDKAKKKFKDVKNKEERKMLENEYIKELEEDAYGHISDKDWVRYLKKNEEKTKKMKRMESVEGKGGKSDDGSELSLYDNMENRPTTDLPTDMSEAIDNAIAEVEKDEDMRKKIKKTIELTDYNILDKTPTDKKAEWNATKFQSGYKEIWGDGVLDLDSQGNPKLNGKKQKPYKKENEKGEIEEVEEILYKELPPEEFKKALSKLKKIKQQLQKSLQRSAANLALSSSVLSEQLLIIAASNKNIKLASKVSSISPLGVFGNVRVFEASKPQFSHKLFWKIEDGKVKIAEVSDVDEDHLNDAYQAAFDAVCKDVLSQNDLREVSGA